jgi:mono/diheme cytochrome c family protein
MLKNDPELHGKELFAQNCASCHVLGDLGDRAKATAPVLDGWGTEAWILGMIHDPDAPERFGHTPYKGEMPSVDVPPADPSGFKPRPKEDMEAIAAFLASLGDEPSEALPPGALRQDTTRTARGQQIVSQACTSCHLYKGSGDDSDTGDAPELSGYGSVAWTVAQVKNPGTPQTYRPAALDPKVKGHMPRFDEQLPAADAELVARWTRAHARGVPLAPVPKK